MKHALIVNHNAGSPYHGPNFRSYYAARGWVKNGIQTTIVCSAFSHKLKQLPQVDGEYGVEEIDGIRYVWLQTGAFSSNSGRLLNYLRFGQKLRLLNEIISEPVDYVICSSPPPFWIWFCRKFAISRNAALIFEARDLWPDVVFETTRLGYLNPAAWLMKIAERTAYRHADHVVSVNESAIEIMRRRGLTEERFTAIPNGISQEKKSAAKLPSIVGKICALRRSGYFVVGYSGALSKVYGLEFLAAAARRLKNEKIAFVLAGTGAFEEFLKQESEGVSNLYLAGWIPKEQLTGFLSAVDICYAGLLDVRSFAYGSDSTKIYEYMKAGKPVVHAIGNRDSVVVRAGCGIRVAPEDSAALGDGILELFRLDRKRLTAMGCSGADYVVQNRDYDVLTRKWLDLFSRLDRISVIRRTS